METRSSCSCLNELFFVIDLSVESVEVSNKVAALEGIVRFLEVRSDHFDLII